MRERGLRRNGMDQKALRHGRDRLIGWTLEQEYFQPVPMFFSAEGNSFPGLVGTFLVRKRQGASIHTARGFRHA